MKANETETMAWLLDGDPAIRWQVMRDLQDAKPAAYQRERTKVALKGWGKRYLSFQDNEGIWGKGLYSPKWKSTFYTLLTLRFIGLPPDHPQAQTAARILLDEGFRADHGINYTSDDSRRKPIKAGRSVKTGRGRGETCITGMALAMFSYFRLDDERVDLITEHLLEHQMKDSGWNCQYPHHGARHASFNTTLLVMEGLREYRLFRPESKYPVVDALSTGREFLLRHQLYRSHRTGKVVSSTFTRFPSQPRWQFNILSALDHFRIMRAQKDNRLQDPIDVLLRKSDAQGRWPEYGVGTAASTWFQMEAPNKPGRWNTLRALRVLRWWRESNGQ